MTDMTTYLQNFSGVPTWNSEPDISKDRATEKTCADIDEQALDYAEVKALCAGNPNTTRGAYGKRAILRYIYKQHLHSKSRCCLYTFIPQINVNQNVID